MLHNFDKDSLLSEISLLEKTIKDKEAKMSDLKDSSKALEEKHAQVKKVYDELVLQLQTITDNLNSVKRDYRSYASEYRADKAKLSDYQRQLHRLLDAESLYSKYKEEYDSFKQKCLEAPWRKENRSDGLGAMDYQIDGAIRLAIAKRGLLGDKMGLGKTLTSLIYLDLVEAKRVIIICPVDTMENFVREIQMWAPHRAAIVLGKRSKIERDILLSVIKDQPQYTLILNYEAWRKDDQLVSDLNNLKADTLILDEAHKIKEMSTKTSQGVIDIAFGYNVCPQCSEPEVKPFRDKRYARCFSCGYGEMENVPLTEFCSIKNVLPMTGTAILNKPQELFPQLKLIDPLNFVSVNKFLDEFCTPVYGQKWTWVYGGEKKIVEKIGPRYVARDRKTAGVHVPSSKPILHEISMTELAESYPRQYKAYQQARDYAQLVLDPDRKLAMSMMYQITVLLRLRQVLTWPAAITLKAPNEETGELEVVANLDVHESAKLDTAQELINDIVDGGERVILFSQFKGPLIELERRLNNDNISVCRYDGDTSPLRKNEIALDFDLKTAPANPRWNVCLGNYKSMGVGLNLHAATHAVILDEEWNPGNQSQAYGRINRVGQTRETTIHTIRVTGNSVDDWLHKLIEEKRNLVQGFENEASQQDIMRQAFDALVRGEM